MLSYRDFIKQQDVEMQNAKFSDYGNVIICTDNLREWKLSMTIPLSPHENELNISVLMSWPIPHLAGDTKEASHQECGVHIGQNKY